MLPLTDQEKSVTYVDYHCGFTLYNGASTKVDQNNREQKNIARSYEKPNASQITINITSPLMKSIRIIIFANRTIYGTWFQQLL